MKALLIVIAVIVIGGSILVDFLWRRWMAARRFEHDADPNRRAGQ